MVNGDPQQAIATQVAFYDTLFTFQQNGGSDDLADYTESYFELYEENIGSIRNQFQLQGLGLMNGSSPASIYSLWSNIGAQSGFTSNLKQHS